MTDEVKLNYKQPFVIDGRHRTETKVITEGKNSIIILLPVMPHGTTLTASTKKDSFTLSFTHDGKTQSFVFDNKSNIQSIVISNGFILDNNNLHYSKKAEIKVPNDDFNKFKSNLETGFIKFLEEHLKDKNKQACAISPYNLPTLHTNKLELA